MDECKDATICRGDCCRSFLGREFCEMESDCIENPTWIVALVPAALGLAALFLIVVVLIRLNQRKVISSYYHIKMKTESLTYLPPNLAVALTPSANSIASSIDSINSKYTYIEDMNIKKKNSAENAFNDGFQGK